MPKSQSFAGIYRGGASPKPTRKTGYSNDVTPKDDRASARKQGTSAGSSRDAATPDGRQVDIETTIQSSISRINAKMERSDQKRASHLQQQVEKTHKWNELSENRMALKQYTQNVEEEMRRNMIEEKKSQ